jgi:hypothetical protein
MPTDFYGPFKTNWTCSHRVFNATFDSTVQERKDFLRRRVELAGLDDQAVLPVRIGGTVGPGRIERPFDIDIREVNGKRFIAWRWMNSLDNRPPIVPLEKTPLLWPFLRLRAAADDEIAQFANKWGPLELCAGHVFPAMHQCSERAETYRELDEARLYYPNERQDRQREPCRPRSTNGVYFEAIEDWRRWAAHLTGVLNLAAALAIGEPRLDLWESVAPLGLAGLTPQETAERPLDQQRALFSSVMTTNLEFGRGLPGLAWDKEAQQYRVYIECAGLFGIIVAQMYAVIVSEVGPANCSRCGEPYQPETLRRPRTDKRRYCPECRPIVEREWKKESARRWRAKRAKKQGGDHG